MADKNLSKIQQLGEKGKIKKLLSYAGSKDADERAAAATALGKNQNDDSYNALVSMLRDPDPSVQIASVRALGELGRPTGQEHIRHVLANTQDPALIAACTESMGRLHETHSA